MKYRAQIACPSCKQRAELELTDKQYQELERWGNTNRRAHIQVALPSWPSAWRETLITGMDSECWDKLVGGEEF